MTRGLLHLGGRARRIVAGMALAWGVSGAQAACMAAPEDFNPLEFGTLVVADAEVGAVVRALRYTLTFTCGDASAPAPHTLTYSSDFPVLPGMNLWATNLPGLALRTRRDGQDIGSANEGRFGTHPGDGSARRFEIDMELVKTGPVRPGHLLGQALVIEASGGPGDPGQAVVRKHVTNSLVMGVACTVQNASKNLVVPLGVVPQSAFTGPGVVQATRAFEIEVMCSPFGTPYATPLSIQMLGETVDGHPDVLKLQGDDAAQGVGIRVLKDDAPLALNTWHSLGDATIRLTTLPFTAHYYQYGERVTAGSGNGALTFLIEMR